MADPFTILAVGSALLGGAQGASAPRQQGRATQQAAEFNAKLAEVRGAQQEGLLRRRSRRRQGAIRTAIAKSGVTLEGSPLQAMADSAAEAEIDALNARFDAMANARLFRMQGQQARRQARQPSASSLLSTGAQIFGMFS